MKIPRETEPDKFKENNRYFKLSFIAKFFTFTKNELQKLIKSFCKKDTGITICFQHV